MQYIKKANALKIAAISTVTSSLEVINVNISSVSIAPEPTQEVKTPELYVTGRDATGGFRAPPCG